jgi:hypothetical protein
MPIKSTAENASADSAKDTRTPLARKAEINCKIRDSIIKSFLNRQGREERQENY